MNDQRERARRLGDEPQGKTENLGDDEDEMDVNLGYADPGGD